jgi:hypothetical protein
LDGFQLLIQIPFTGVAQSKSEGQAAINSIAEQLGGVFTENANKNAGSLVTANLSLYKNNIDTAGTQNVQASFASAFGNTPFLVIGAVVVLGAVLLMRKGAN